MIYVAPSVLSADFIHLQEEINRVEEAGADWLHLDIMDGQFVPNITIGPQVVADIRSVTSLFLDVHLMIEKPENLITAFVSAGADLITVHQEACPHLHRTVHMIKDNGLKAGVALNPATPVSTLADIMPELDLLLIMSVNPGFGGQKFISQAIKKIKQSRTLLDSMHSQAWLEVDGGINPDTGKQCLDAGCNVFVAGSYIFKADDIGAAVRKLKKMSPGN